jgi:ketosteroid isomerase-like protein
MELEDDLIVVTARARLSFEEASVAEFNGVTTLILRKVDGRWRIAYDHSS